MTLPPAYAWLASEPGPKMILEALKLYGVHEAPGSVNDPVIMGWAAEMGLSSVYSSDAIPWCGLFMAIVAKRAGKQPPLQPLWALNWGVFGNAVPDYPKLGDVLIFKRDGGGHVAMYVGEDADHYHVLGGNQGDAVSISRIAKDRLYKSRRPVYSAEPDNVRVIHLAALGAASRNEA